MNGMRHVKSGSGDHEHTKTDGLGDAALLAAGADPWRSRPRSERMAAHKIECNACPVLCQISEGKVGACDRYANSGGVLVRVDPVLLVRKAVTAGQGVDEGALIPFAAADAAATPAPADADGPVFVTAVGASTTYPDYKPAPFIVATQAEGVDMVTVVTEGIFSYCSMKVKIDTDRWLGPEQANVRCNGEVVVVDDHITGVLTEHQAGRCLDMRPAGLKVRGRKSTPGRYFQVANPGTGWGGTDIDDPMNIVESWDTDLAWPGLRLLMVSTTGEHAQYFVLDEQRVPRPRPMPDDVQRVVERIGENCEPSLATVLFVGGAGGSLRAGVTENPVQLTRAIKAALVNVTCGGAPAYVWPGGGITVMVDVARMPDGSFGTVPTPAIVAPIEFTMRLADYRDLGGHMRFVRPLAEVLASGAWHQDGAPTARRFVAASPANPWPIGRGPLLG